MATTTALNPWDWSQQFGYHQGVRIDNVSVVVHIAGQTAVDANGAPKHPGNMAAQMELALDNLESVLSLANLGLADLCRIGVYVTDMAAARHNFGIVGARLAAAGAAPPMTLVEVSALAIESLMIEIDASAVC